MGLIGAAFGIGFVMGPAIATGLIHPGFHDLIAGTGLNEFAAWMQANKFALPGFFAAGLSLLSFILVWFLLEETVETGTAKTIQKPTGSPIAEPVYKRYSVFSPTFWKTLVPDNTAGGGFFGMLLLSIFLLSFGQASLYSAFPLFCEEVLGMGAEQVGVQFFYIGLIAVVVQGGLIKYITRWFAEERVFLVGNILMTAGMALIAWSGTISVLTLFIGIMALGHSLNLPTVHSLISKEADPFADGRHDGYGAGAVGAGAHHRPDLGRAPVRIRRGPALHPDLSHTDHHHLGGHQDVEPWIKTRIKHGCKLRCELGCEHARKH
jgi:MFS transporter, DHA1 family, tetracycline resistance protein